MASPHLERELRRAEERAEQIRSEMRRNSDRDQPSKRTRHDGFHQDRQTDYRPRDYSPSYRPEAYHPRGNDLNPDCLPHYCLQGQKLSAKSFNTILETLDNSAKTMQ